MLIETQKSCLRYFISMFNVQIDTCTIKGFVVCCVVLCYLSSFQSKKLKIRVLHDK